MVEFLGTFLFLSVFISTAQPALIALTLLLVTTIGMSISGAHYNPAASLMYWAKGALTNQDLLIYILVQCLAGISAAGVYRLLGSGAVEIA